MSDTELALGYISLFISCTAFGFMFAPLKRFDTKDGIFVQWVQCSVVFMAGFIINIARGLPPFNLIASIGGFLYATGNVASVPIVSEMGIGLGMLSWGSVQIIVGWCVAHFGFFGTKAQTVDSPIFNYLGVILTLFSGLMFVFVYSREEEANVENGKTTPTNVPLNTTTTELEKSGERGPYGSTSNVWAVNSSPTEHQNASPIEGENIRPITIEGMRVNSSDLPWEWARKMNLTKRKLFFIGLAICLGSFHGLMMTPIVFVQDTDPNAANNVLDYVFSHFSAVFFFSTLYFMLYSLIKKGRPFVQSKLVLPSIAYGVLWTIGMTLFILSNRILSQTVSFPITVRLPAIIGALADVFLFKCIHGKRRLAFLFAAILIGSIGVIFVGISLVS